VKLTVALLRAVATDAELATLAQDAPSGLADLSLHLQQRFEARLLQVEARLHVTRKGKWTPSAVETRLQQLDRVESGIKQKLQQRSST
jgi:hypothetical protein